MRCYLASLISGIRHWIAIKKISGCSAFADIAVNCAPFASVLHLSNCSISPQNIGLSSKPDFPLKFNAFSITISQQYKIFKFDLQKAFQSWIQEMDMFIEQLECDLYRSRQFYQRVQDNIINVLLFVVFVSFVI